MHGVIKVSIWGRARGPLIIDLKIRGRLKREVKVFSPISPVGDKTHMEEHTPPAGTLHVKLPKDTKKGAV